MSAETLSYGFLLFCCKKWMCNLSWISYIGVPLQGLLLLSPIVSPYCVPSFTCHLVVNTHFLWTGFVFLDCSSRVKCVVRKQCEFLVPRDLLVFCYKGLYLWALNSKPYLLAKVGGWCFVFGCSLNKPSFKVDDMLSMYLGTVKAVSSSYLQQSSCGVTGSVWKFSHSR